MHTIAWVGYLAAFCTTGSFALQVLHIIRHRETKAISLGMYIVFVFGVFCWLAYGIYSKDIPLTIANGITFILAGAVLILKVSSERKR